MTNTVAELWRFPIKSMQGESVSTLTITPQGAVGDRAYGLLDVATGKIASAKNVRLFPHLMACRAAYVQAPEPDAPPPPVRMDLPNGVSVCSDDADVDDVLSGYFERDVRLVQAPQAVATYDQYQADTAGNNGDETGIAGAFRDAWPLSILTQATLRQLAEYQADSRFDPRRFRMNFIIATAQTGFIENDWLGQELGLGDDVRLHVGARDSRCVMTTLPQADLPHDPEVLRTIARHNKVHVEGRGDRPCAGVYAQVAAPGVVRVGDAVNLA